ncbi:MAG: hypothetical protein ACI9AP_000032 [Flavobacteriales bacterium]
MRQEMLIRYEPVDTSGCSNQRHRYQDYLWLLLKLKLVLMLVTKCSHYLMDCTVAHWRWREIKITLTA